MSTTKTRLHVIREHQGRLGFKAFLASNSFLNFENTHSGSLTAMQSTTSEGHPFPIKGFEGDLGGEFLTDNVVYSDNCRHLRITYNNSFGVNYYEGTIFPFMSSRTSPVNGALGASVSPSSEVDIDAAGTTAIALVLPTNPVAGLATFFGELREGFPRIIGSTLFEKGGKLGNKVGEEYLNYSFGWAPMVSDFKKWLHSIRHADRIWKQFQRDAGRRVRRRYYFPETTEVILDDVSSPVPSKNGPVDKNFWRGDASKLLYPLYRNITLKRRRWFSGSFTYYLQDNPAAVKRWNQDLQRLDKLYGVKITPDVIWNLTPWSWAADWFGNTGDIIHNMTKFSQDGLVMPYGYMMEQSILRAEYRMKDLKPTGFDIPDLTQVFTRTIKYRRRATPFGFGLDPVSFTPFQLSILTSLGLSRK